MLNMVSLWKNHPGSSSRPCSVLNQCAVRMGVALGKSGVNMKRYKGVKCWHGHHPAHSLRAQEMADWIADNPHIFGVVKKYKNVRCNDFFGKQGIVFFMNFHGTGNQGDHIDLWDGWWTKAGRDTYFEKAAQVWFWEIK